PWRSAPRPLTERLRRRPQTRPHHRPAPCSRCRALPAATTPTRLVCSWLSPWPSNAVQAEFRRMFDFRGTSRELEKIDDEGPLNVRYARGTRAVSGNGYRNSPPRINLRKHCPAHLIDADQPDP